MNDTNLPKPVGFYSQAIVTGNLLFSSGQIALNPKTNQLVDGNADEQLQQIIKNLKALLASFNLTLDDVVKTTIYLTDMANFEKINNTYGRHFKTPYPARETVGVKELPKGAKIEVAIIASCK